MKTESTYQRQMRIANSQWLVTCEGQRTLCANVYAAAKLCKKLARAGKIYNWHSLAI